MTRKQRATRKARADREAHVNVGMDKELRDRLLAAARGSVRSLSAECLVRLRSTFEPDRAT
jgi:hypothetical protein